MCCCKLNRTEILTAWNALVDKPVVNELPANLKEFVNNPLFSDVTFVIEDKEVVAHRAILAARSGYFRSLLSDGSFGDDKVKLLYIYLIISHC